MFKKVFVLFILTAGLATSIRAQKNAPALVSGMPVANGSADGIGRFALPSLSGMIMGTALTDNDTCEDLFIQSDKRAPGTFLYRFRKFTAQGEPVFSQGIKLKLPFEDKGENRGIVVQTSERSIYGFWRFSKTLKFSEFDATTNEFIGLRTIQIEGIPRSFSTFGVLRTADNRYLFLFTVSKPGIFSDPKAGPDSARYTPEGFWPYDLQETGVYGAVISDFKNITKMEVHPLTELTEAYFGISGYAFYQGDKGGYVLCGTRLGNILAYPFENGKLLSKAYLTDEEDVLHRNPTVHSYPVYFRGSEGREGLITSGEGGIYFYENTRRRSPKGNLIFKDPVTLMQENPLLYGGSLVVPDLVDWDGDGITDIISGASSGHILFFKNAGTNEHPAFLSPEPLTAGGYKIHVQPGYREDIQGPQEARWGYTCPTAYDWNGDGLPDILTGDSRGKFMVYINRGTSTRPVLEPERSLYMKGLDVFGGWRAKPGVGELDGRTVYIILDRENEFHLYRRIDDYNIADGGKLRLTDGSYIKANRRPGGQVGRSKIHLVDWDGDGVKDLLVGTGRAASIPNPVNGLPYHRRKKNEGAAVLFLRNAGTNSKPVFEFPRMMKFKGEDILLGAHSCAPATAVIGESKTLNLLVGTEYGTYIFYDRKDLSW